MRHSKRPLRLAAISTLIPVVFACELLLPEHATLHVGVGEALACGGSASTAPPASGWSWLNPRLHSGPDAGPVPLATDGFFVIDAAGYLLSADAAAASLQVVVKDENGATVAGETKLLLEPQDGTYVFGWSASAPLVVGAKLQATLSATSAASTVGGEFPLAVVGEPMTLPVPSFSYPVLFDFFHGLEGPQVTCEPARLGNCEPPVTHSVPLSIQRQLGAELSWRLPPITSGVAWSVRIEAESAVQLLDLRLSEFFGNTQGGPELVVGRVAFPPNAKPCASLVLTDLRTNKQTRAENCAPTEPIQGAATDTELAQCSESPSSTLTAAWCLLKQGSSASPACAAAGGSGGAGGAGGSSAVGGYLAAGGFFGPASDYFPGGAWSTSPGAPGTSSTPGGTAAASNASDGPRTSQGCQLGGSSSSRAGHLAWLLVLGLLVRRRQEVSR